MATAPISGSIAILMMGGFFLYDKAKNLIKKPTE